MRPCITFNNNTRPICYTTILLSKPFFCFSRLCTPQKWMWWQVLKRVSQINSFVPQNTTNRLIHPKKIKIKSKEPPYLGIFAYSFWYSEALRYSACSSKYSINRFKNPSLLTVSVSQTRQHCLLARVTATFIRLRSLRNPTWNILEK